MDHLNKLRYDTTAHFRVQIRTIGAEITQSAGNENTVKNPDLKKEKSCVINSLFSGKFCDTAGHF